MNKVIATGIIEGEGPVVKSDGTFWAVEMAEGRACVSRVSVVDGIVPTINVGGRPNGMTIDGDDRLWVAEARHGAVICYDGSGEIVRKITHPTKRFLWANDLRFGPNGLLYLTDSGVLDTKYITGISIDPGYRGFDYEGCIFEIDPVAGTILRTIDAGMIFANGLAFDADGFLYVNETLSGNVYRYDLSEADPARSLFGNVYQPGDYPDWSGPDGMAFGADGRLYCTVYGQGGISVLDRSGKLVDVVKTNGVRTTNIAFVGNTSTAIITEVENSAVELVEMPCPGLPLHRPSLAL
ncbi:SMP-30/gluconolactonase/LRE family protein [Rhizobium multihospitium]|uniref:Gluconolactonase n=1 Tax=Rhizobium multihospitium TaxID=410764 RepID=A0A1C3X5K9_9HYPH|nr:SMP-30/gluconolactonase/LRE family protein [Rhizobium multihospitium]SCB47475.1 gluconolactonase [Rhizobium multihospitium]